MMGIRLYKRGKVWWIEARRGDGSKERWSLRTEDRQLAAKAARVYEERLVLGERLRQQPPAAQAPTFAQFAQDWLERKALSRRKSTLAGYRGAVAEASKILGPLPIHEVTRTDALRVAEALVRGGRGERGCETVERNLAYLQSLFSDAAEELRRGAEGGPRIAVNPFSNKSRLLDGLIERDELGEDPERDVQPYSAEELAAIERAAAETLDAADRLKVMLGLDAGLRRSEVLGLHRADLELAQQWTWVRRRFSRGEVGATKTKRSRRRVPLTDRLAAAVRAHLLEQGLSSVALFPPRKRRRAGGTGYEDEKRFGERFARMLEAAGVEVRGHPFHRLRHTWVSRLLAAGVEPYLVSKWAGHRSTAFTEEVYAEWMPGDTHRERVNRPGHNLDTPRTQSNSSRERGES